MFTHAITRSPAASFGEGLTQAGLGPPDYELMCEQHAAYVNALRKCGLEVRELDPLEAFPDACFVEDAAVVTDDVAVVTIPGAPSRQGETESLAAVLSEYRPITRIHPPGTVDGGDVLIVGRRAFIGLSTRTNSEGARQLGEILAHHGYHSTPVPLQSGLHLKSDVNYIGGDTLLLTPRYARRAEFDGMERIILTDRESYAANTLLVNHHLLVPRGFPDTVSKLGRTGHLIVELDVSEVQKMDGGLTCMSLRFDGITVSTPA